TPASNQAVAKGYALMNRTPASVFSTSNVWNDISLLNQAFLTLLRPPYGINNYVNICNGLANFYSCLGPKNIFNCLGLVGLVGNNKSPQDAYSYMGLLADWRFKCGAGFFAVYESTSFTSCTQSTYVNYNNDMNKIVNDYKKNVTADTNNACKQTLSGMDASQVVNTPTHSSSIVNTSQNANLPFRFRFSQVGQYGDTYVVYRMVF
ncbi:hypothetical protein ANCCAN_05638, partial [Ancylostoma caninum]